MADPSIQEQTRQSISNCQAVLAAAGAGLADVVSVTVLLPDRVCQVPHRSADPNRRSARARVAGRSRLDPDDRRDRRLTAEPVTVLV
jgi:enamine deaminase RidA (YjgF/YER057c/UK114 family)